MASKGQKFKKYPFELKNKILKEYLDGLGGECSLAKKYGIPRETIKNWITKNLTLEDYKERYEILKKYQAFLQARREKK